MKPIVDGKGVQQLYQCKPGKHMKFIIDEGIKYQIINPQAQREEIESHLLENKDAFLEKYS